MLDGFSQEQLVGYLKYVWGRTRLGQAEQDTHKLTNERSKKGIPIAHTCFFELDLGTYTSDDDFRVKLLAGINNCGDNYDSNAVINFDVQDRMIEEF